jgi:hypothetical protein
VVAGARENIFGLIFQKFVVLPAQTAKSLNRLGDFPLPVIELGGPRSFAGSALR